MVVAVSDVGSFVMFYENVVHCHCRLMAKWGLDGDNVDPFARRLALNVVPLISFEDRSAATRDILWIPFIVQVSFLDVVLLAVPSWVTAALVF